MAASLRSSRYRSARQPHIVSTLFEDGFGIVANTQPDKIIDEHHAGAFCFIAYFLRSLHITNKTHNLVGSALAKLCKAQYPLRIIAEWTVPQADIN